jgi:hypothetical protein
MLLTIAYTGMRWGETVGLERSYLHGSAIHVEWQLREFLGADGGHHRRSNYARRMFRPACDGLHTPVGGTIKTVIADSTTWPGVPIAAWPAGTPGDAATAAEHPRRPRHPQDTVRDTAHLLATNQARPDPARP